MLRLSTKGRYGTRVMVRLAVEGNGRTVPRQRLAETEGVSTDYVEQILIKLKTAGLVVSHRGVKGGYSLARKPDEISVADVVEATDGPISLSPCTEEYCARATVCVTWPIWEKANDALKAVFSETSIAQLAAETVSLGQANLLNFEI